MKKQAYFDMGQTAGLSPLQIERILCHILNVSKEALFLLSDISGNYLYEFQQVLYKYAQGIPEAYLLGKIDFYGREFYVDERVLIPRVETEILVQECLKILNSDRDIKNTIYIDVGTGSSCIATSVLSELLPLRFKKSYALDISKKALEVAEKNIKKFNLDIELRESNLLEAIFHEEIFKNTNLCISANLPYIKNGDYKNMSDSTVKYEPDSALYGGVETGFEMYKELIKQCFQMKKIHNIGMLDLFIEIGFDQRDVSKSVLVELGLKFEYFQDSANIARVIHIYGF